MQSSAPAAGLLWAGSRLGDLRAGPHPVLNMGFPPGLCDHCSWSLRGSPFQEDRNQDAD